MMGNKERSFAPLIHVSLEELVPHDHFYRHLALVMLAYSFLMLQRLQLPLPMGEDFPPSVTRSSLPYVHRQVLLWLFQNLVLWLIQTDQIKTFRPRRN